MKKVAVSCLILASATTSVSAVTPVQKVIQMMEAMVTKGNAAIKTEQDEWAEEKEFCEVTIIKKKRAIDDANEQIEMLKAEIEKAGTDADDLAREIEAHQATVDSSTSELEEATKVRTKEEADFKLALKDYTESITAIGKAMTVLNKQPKSRAQAEAFLQLKALSSMKSWPEDAKRSLDSFLEEDQPQAKGYESQSNGVIEMLDKLKSQFIDERTELQKAELQKKNAYTMLKAGLDNEIEQATKDRDDKSQTKGKRLEAKSIAEGDLAETTDAMQADTKYREDLIVSCRKKGEEYDESQKLRKEEMEAVGKAIEIISGGAVSGAADTHLPSLLSESSAFAAMRSSFRSPALGQVMKQLQRDADRLQSRELSAIALRIGQDPAGAAMKKVADMIKDMVVKLKKQAAEEATQQAWCAGEMKTNTATRKEKTQEVEGIQADIDELKASMVKLGEEVTQLTADIQGLDEAMAKSTEIRQKEKEKNSVQIKDAKEAQSAVAQAVAVLQEFYAKAGESKVYNGQTGESGGVLGMIEVIQTDFARLEAEATAAEEAGTKEYETFMKDSKLDKTKKEKDVEHKNARKEREGQQVVSKTEDLSGVQKELDAAEEYYKTLVPKCVDKGPSYEEKKAKREEEIKSLKEALNALDLIR